MALLIKHTILFFLILVVFIAKESNAQITTDTNIELYEQEIKSGLIYNFLKYTEWPKQADELSSSKITVCIFGDDPFDGNLDPMVGRTVNQKEITILNIHTVSEVNSCHLLYLNAKESSHWQELHNSLAGKSVLTVSDLKNFAKSGGMIEFGRINNRVNVEMNLEAVLSAKLQVQDRLLKLVTVLHPDSQNGGR